MRSVRYSLSLFLALFFLFVYLLSPQRSVVQALHDCIWAGAGLCDASFGSQPSGNDVCSGRENEDNRTECRQGGSGEFPYFECCSPHNEPPPPEPPPPEPAGCYSDWDCVDGNPCTVDYCLGSGSPGSLCVNNSGNEGNVCQRNPNN